MRHPMTSTVLGIDSASGACSAAIVVGGKVVARRFEIMTRGQAERLAPMIRDVLDEAGAGADALDIIGVTVGPGAFTGVRIGLSAARGLGLASATPVIGVTTFDAVAAARSEDRGDATVIVAVIESRRDDFFLQLIDDAGEAMSPPQALETDGVAALLATKAAGQRLFVAGDGAHRLWGTGVFEGLDAALDSNAGLPDAVHVARLADARAMGPSALPPTPLYLRPPDVMLPGAR